MSGGAGSASDSFLSIVLQEAVLSRVFDFLRAEEVGRFTFSSVGAERAVQAHRAVVEIVSARVFGELGPQQ